MTHDRPFMTVTDIAELVGFSTRHVRDVIVKLPKFPQEATISSPRKRLWLRSDIEAFVLRSPSQIPHDEPEHA